MKVLRAINGLDGLVQAGLVAPEAAPALNPVEAAFRIRVTGAMQKAITAPVYSRHEAD